MSLNQLSCEREVRLEGALLGSPEETAGADPLCGGGAAPACWSQSATTAIARPGLATGSTPPRGLPWTSGRPAAGPPPRTPNSSVTEAHGDGPCPCPSRPGPAALKALVRASHGPRLLLRGRHLLASKQSPQEGAAPERGDEQGRGARLPPGEQSQGLCRAAARAGRALLAESRPRRPRSLQSGVPECTVDVLLNWTTKSEKSRRGFHPWEPRPRGPQSRQRQGVFLSPGAGGRWPHASRYSESGSVSLRGGDLGGRRAVRRARSAGLSVPGTHWDCVLGACGL